MLVSKRERLLNVCLHCFFVLIICIAALWGIERNTTVTILTDEFAYWASAAWLNGRNWSSVLANFPYYGYGYGFVLAIIMKAFYDVRIMYQVALILNVVMLVCNYFIAYKCWMMLINRNKWLGMVGSFMAVIYVSNIFYARMTFVEVFFSFLFWGLIYLSITMTHSRLKKMIFCLILTLLLASHNRALGIVAASILSIFVCWNKEERKEKLELILFLILGYFLFYVGKRYFQSVLYPNPENGIMEITDTVGQVSKIKFLLNENGFFSFVISLLGKVYYVLVSTFFVVGFGCIYAVKKIVYCFRQKKWTGVFPYFFAITSFGAVLCISAIYFAPSYQYRMDTLLYGRYHECLLGPLIIFGFAEIIQHKNSGKEISCIALIGVLLTIVTTKYIPHNQSITNFGINCAGLSDLFYKSFSIDETIYVALLRGIGFVVLIYISKSRKKYNNWFLMGCFSLLAVCWIKTAIFDADTRIYQWTEETVVSNNRLLEDIKQYIGNLEEIYFYQRDKENYNISFIQFMQPDAEIIYLEDRKALEDLDIGTIILTDNEADNTDKIIFDEPLYELISSNYYFTAWRKKSG